jgi:hypothetical protein
MNKRLIFIGLLIMTQSISCETLRDATDANDAIPEKILVITIDQFIENFKEYVKNINTEDYTVLSEDFKHGSLDDWDTLHGKLADKMIKLTKRYFDVKMLFYPWYFPESGSGVLMMFIPNGLSLNDLAHRLSLDAKEHIMDPEEVDSLIMSIYT